MSGRIGEQSGGLEKHETVIFGRVWITRNRHEAKRVEIVRNATLRFIPSHHLGHKFKSVCRTANQLWRRPYFKIDTAAVVGRVRRTSMLKRSGNESKQIRRLGDRIIERSPVSPVIKRALTGAITVGQKHWERCWIGDKSNAVR